MRSYFSKMLAFFALCMLMMTPWGMLEAQHLQVGVQNRSGIQHDVNAKTGPATAVQKPTAVNPKILPKAPEDFKPKIRWHQSNLERHWDKHKAEFPEFKTAKEYGDAALYFFSMPPQGTLTKVDKETGDKKFYHRPSNTFGVMTSQGFPKTMFRPSAGINYWERQ